MRLRPPRAFWVVLDWLAAAFCWFVVFGSLFVANGHGPHNFLQLLSPRSLVTGLLALGLAAPVAFRRRAPGKALVVVLALSVVVLLARSEVSRGPFLPLALVLYVVASASRRAVAVTGLAVALILLGVQGLEMHFSGQGSGNAVAVSLVLTIVWVVGYSVQQRRSYMTQVQERAASDAVTRERLRIARELHDVVAHSMTVVTVQAGYGEYVFDSQPGEARAALGAIQSVSREALGEMQRLLGVLRQTSAAAAGEAALTAGTAVEGAPGPAAREAPGTALAGAPDAPAPPVAAAAIAAGGGTPLALPGARPGPAAPRRPGRRPARHPGRGRAAPARAPHGAGKLPRSPPRRG